uniref:C-type lectin domain-containing protein n=1 Tax=Echeneis naucrates TaxID=173247 RepID=A0A665UHJ5_ECHNA
MNGVSVQTTGLYLYLQPLGFGCSLSSGSQFPPRQYHYVNFTTNWSDAQRYCREHYTDLATFESMDDVNMLKSNFSSDTWAWIGLEDPPESWKWNMGNDTNSWRWSVTGETSKTGYESWAQTEPNNEHGHENCVFTSPSGQWLDASCEITKGFVCFNDCCYSLIHVLENVSANRQNIILCVITQVSSLITDSSGSWIGLFREPWRWTDGSQSSFRNWRENSPNNAGGEQFCIVEDTQRHVWDDDGCDKQYVFICHQGEISHECFLFIDYYHVDQPKTWTDAQKYCREKYTDLLSIESNDDLRLMNSVSVPTTWSWIGLHDDPKSWKGVMGKDENSWRWSATGETSENGFQNWAPTEPNNFGSNQHCVRISPEGEWIDRRCTERLQFVCYNGEIFFFVCF